MLRHSLFASMVPGGGQKHDDKSFDERLMLVVGRVTAPQFGAFSSIEVCRHSSRE